MKPLKIYLCDLTYDTISLATDAFPLNIGFVAAYCKNKFKERVDIELFKYPKDLDRAIKEHTPDILGMSNYPWNFNLGLAFFKMIKQISPNTVTVMGGPNIPLEDKERTQFILKNPLIDFYAYLEGEDAFCNLVERVFEYKDNVEKMKLTAIHGMVHRIDEENLLKGSFLKRRKALDDIPSPYLTGFMDKFFDGRLGPMIETNRGCPFTCSFCHEGHSLITKVNYYSLERTHAELDYIAAKVPLNVSHLTITDSNFGMYERDYEICEHINRLQKDSNYPRYTRASTGKNRKDRISKAFRLLNGSLQFGLSVQSVDPEVLENIKRQNIKLEVITMLADEYARLGLPSNTEVIVGLPGETFKSHKFTLAKLLESGIDAVIAYNLMLLNGTEMGTDAHREKYGVKSHFRVIPRDFGKLDNGEISVEIEEIVTSSDSMTFDEYVECRVYHLLIQSIYNNELYNPFFKLIRQKNIPIIDFLTIIRENSSRAPESFRNFLEAFIKDTKGELWDDYDELNDYCKKEENYEKLCAGKMGHNLLQTYGAIATKMFSEWNEYIFSMFKELLNYNEISEENQKMLHDVNNFCVNRVHNIWGSDRCKNNPKSNFTYNIAEWMRTSRGANIEEFKFNKPTDVEFKYTDQQNKDIDDWLERYGNTPTGIGRILVKINSASWVLRQPHIT